MKILIADDSRVMRQIVTRTLRQAGFGDHDLVEAADGRQAYDKTVAEKPDLVISDWNMPEMTGIEVLRKLRASRQRRAVRLRHLGVHAGDAAGRPRRRRGVLHHEAVHRRAFHRGLRPNSG